MKDVLVILDNGHGKDTPGKCSPDKRLKEWEFTRDIAKRVKELLDNHNVRCSILVEEDKDISLSQRANRANTLHSNEKKKGNTSILISIHANAAGNGIWSNAKGWEVFSTVGRTNSDKLAEKFIDNFSYCFSDRKLRGHKEKNFTIIYKANMPAVLTENFFYDNKEECEWMMSDDCRDRIASLHYRAILEYIATI